MLIGMTIYEKHIMLDLETLGVNLVGTNFVARFSLILFLNGIFLSSLSPSAPPITPTVRVVVALAVLP